MKEIKPIDDIQINDLKSSFASVNNFIEGSLPDVEEVNDLTLTVTKIDGVYTLYIAVDGVWKKVAVLTSV